MKHLASAIVDAAAFLELSEDSVIDPDSAVKAMEDIAWNLGRCSAEETEAIRVAAAEAASSAQGDEAREFFENFIEGFGVGTTFTQSE